MKPFTLPITVTRGITFATLVFNLQNDDATPFDLTGWKVFAHARQAKDARQKIDLGPIISDAVNGQVKISFTDEQTFAQMSGKYNWDFILEAADGVRTGPYFAGPYTVQELYTHNG